MKRNRSLRKKVLKDLNIKEKCCKNAVMGHIVSYIIRNRNKCIDVNTYLNDCFDYYNTKANFSLSDDLKDFLLNSNERWDFSHKLYIGEVNFDKRIQHNQLQIIELEKEIQKLKDRNETLRNLRYNHNKGK